MRDRKMRSEDRSMSRHMVGWTRRAWNCAISMESCFISGSRALTHGYDRCSTGSPRPSPCAYPAYLSTWLALSFSVDCLTLLFTSTPNHPSCSSHTCSTLIEQRSYPFSTVCHSATSMYSHLVPSSNKTVFFQVLHCQDDPRFRVSVYFWSPYSSDSMQLIC